MTVTRVHRKTYFDKTYFFDKFNEIPVHKKDGFGTRKSLNKYCFLCLGRRTYWEDTKLAKELHLTVEEFEKEKRDAVEVHRKAREKFTDPYYIQG